MEEKIEAVKAILSQSDIVWPRYGCDNIEDLAKRIVAELEAADEE